MGEVDDIFLEAIHENREEEEGHEENNAAPVQMPRKASAARKRWNKVATFFKTLKLLKNLEIKKLERAVSTDIISIYRYVL